MLEILGRSACSSDAFLQFGLSRLKPLNAVLIGFDQRRAFRVHGAVDKLGDIALDLANLGFPFLLAVLDALGASLPELAEHAIGQHEHVMRWAHILEDGFELSFDLLAGNGLAVVGAFLVRAVIIGVAFGAALRPIAGQAGIAASANDEAA
ncbi:MAG: hypothetical protein WBL20_21265 [Sphingobium sp.]|uniref:hypothetical protein n=1 Tax=Sphingobium sp. TaxID=1912891 RepID=UPI002E1D64CE